MLILLSFLCFHFLSPSPPPGVPAALTYRVSPALLTVTVLLYPLSPFTAPLPWLSALPSLPYSLPPPPPPPIWYRLLIRSHLVEWTGSEIANRKQQLNLCQGPLHAWSVLWRVTCVRGTYNTLHMDGWLASGALSTYNTLYMDGWLVLSTYYCKCP